MPIRRPYLVGCVLLATTLVYLNSFQNSFHFDDFHTITDNPAVRSLANLPRIFKDATAFSVLPANQTYRPVVTASLAFDYALGRGYVPFWFHLSTLVWFLVLITVLFAFAEKVFQRTLPSPANTWLAAGVAAWFGLHPVMAETVNYVIQRGDLYCTLGCLAALLTFACWPRQRRYGLYLLPFGLAMLSKPPASVFPILLLFYAYFFEVPELSRPARWRASLKMAVPAIVTTGALLWLQSAMTPKTYAPTILSASAYRTVQPFVWLRYFSALFLPLHLNVDTDLQPMQSWTAATYAGVFFLVGVLAITLYASRKRRLYPIAYGLIWFVVTQLPTSLYTLSEVENDHRMFFSFPGLMISVVWALYLGYERLRSKLPAGSRLPALSSKIAGFLCLLGLCGYAYGAHRRNEVWRDEPNLWADDVAKSPHNGRGLMIYGLTRMNAGDLRGALDLFNRALAFTPNYPTLEINLGIVNGLLASNGDAALRARAEEHFQRAVSLAPLDDLTHAYYGRWLLSQGRLGEATTQLQTAVALNGQRSLQRDLLLDAYTREGNHAAAVELAQSTLASIPGDATALAILQGRSSSGSSAPVVALVNASLASYRSGKYEQSITEAQQALKLDAGSAEAWNNIGACYGALHQWQQAVHAEQEALRLNPGLEIAGNNLRWFQSQQLGSADTRAHPGQSVADLINLSLAKNQGKDYVGSIDAARRALALDPGSAEAWNNIAAADEALGRWDQAIEAARKAIALRPDFQLAKNNLQWSLQQQQATRR